MKRILRVSLALMLIVTLVTGTTSALAAGQKIAVNKHNFPDTEFRAYVLRYIDKNGDRKLSSAEIMAVREIQLCNKNIKDLKGIEFFTNIVELYCSNTSIKKLDVRNNKKLTSINVDHTPLISLKLGKKEKLFWLIACDTRLSSINIGGCPILLREVKLGRGFFGGTISWLRSDEDEGLIIDTSTVVKNGKKVLYKYAKLTSIMFSKKTLTIKKGHSYDIWKIVNTKPASAVYPVKWTSSRESVGRIDEYGVFTAEAKGTTIITAKVRGGVSASFKIIVV